jgi:hypothetical protein
MRSPFPGMDPYLEKSWRDVHHRLCTYACDALQPQVQPALLARIDERLVVEYDGRRERDISPDVTITESEPWQMSGGGGTATMESAEPLVLLDDEPIPEGFIRIAEGEEGRLVTVIEFLSLTNKLPGDGQEKYLQKRNEYYETGVNLVEVDLLRRGERIVMASHRIPRSHRTTYQVCVRRAYNWRTEIYAVPLRRALPTIRVPLRERDADAHLNLQALIEQTYRNGAYGSIDYTQPPDPPLDAADAAWAAELVRTAPRA